jgi:hypothetical protein
MCHQHTRTNFQLFHDGFNLQDRLFRQCGIVMELISDDWYISEKTNNIKANEGI